MSSSSQSETIPDAPPAGGQDPEFVKGAFSEIADKYVLTNHVLSVGTDILWRRRAGKIVAAWEPKTILDVASGTGDLALELQHRCREAEVVATDFCPAMLDHAAQRGVRQTQVADALNLPFDDGSFDAVTVAFGLRNMASWEDGLREMGRVIAPGGHLLVLDFSLPGGVLRKPYAFYLNKVLPKIAGTITCQRHAYEYLAGSIERFPSGRDMIALWEKCGYDDVQWIPLTGGIASIYTGRRT